MKCWVGVMLLVAAPAPSEMTLRFFSCLKQYALLQRNNGAAVPTTTRIRRDESARYHIRFGGMLDPSWGAMLGAMMFTVVECDADTGTTSLRGLAVDQAALLGVLNSACDLGMVLLSVELEPEPPGT